MAWPLYRCTRPSRCSNGKCRSNGACQLLDALVGGAVEKAEQVAQHVTVLVQHRLDTTLRGAFEDATPVRQIRACGTHDGRGLGLIEEGSESPSDLRRCIAERLVAEVAAASGHAGQSTDRTHRRARDRGKGDDRKQIGRWLPE